MLLSRKGKFTLWKSKSSRLSYNLVCKLVFASILSNRSQKDEDLVESVVFFLSNSGGYIVWIYFLNIFSAWNNDITCTQRNVLGFNEAYGCQRIGCQTYKIYLQYDIIHFLKNKNGNNNTKCKVAHPSNKGTTKLVYKKRKTKTRQNIRKYMFIHGCTLEQSFITVLFKPGASTWMSSGRI